MAINTGMRRAGLVGTCLLLLASCAGNPAVQRRFEAECKAAGHAEGSKQFAACVGAMVSAPCGSWTICARG